MGKHVLTAEERVRGLRAAIVSPRTPEHLRGPLKDQLRALQAKLASKKKKISVAEKRKQRASLLDWLDI